MNLTEAEVVVVARVEASEPERSVVLRPEVYLKGPAQSAVISLSFPDPRPRCPLARFDPGARVLAVLDAAGGDLSWPGAGDVWLIAGGVATKPEPSPDERPEADLIRAVRSITGQYAVPAANGEEGASIDWVGTVLPVSAALLVVFAIGLLLMRTWHRIDPS